jgi:lactoylglutathione lyase
MTMTDVADRSKPAADTDKYRLLHTMIRVRDLDASLQFYTDLLGMKLLRKRDYPTGKFTLAFVGYGDESDNTVIELTHKWDQAEHLDGQNASGRSRPVYKTAAPCRGEIPRPRSMAWRLGHAFIEDPDGYRIRLVQHIIRLYLLRDPLREGDSRIRPPLDRRMTEAGRKGWRGRLSLDQDLVISSIGAINGRAIAKARGTSSQIHHQE